MRDNISTYKIWSPDTVSWTKWVKPVLFASLPHGDYDILNIPEIKWIDDVNRNTMIIIDLPNERGVEEGLALANLGYRPVPLYNGVKGPNQNCMIVDVTNIEKALYKGADLLENIDISVDAPPAFILDSRRMEGLGKQPGKFDNRWCIFPQDMPSASYLVKEGISKIIVRSSEIRVDLSHILCRYQELGIKIYLCNNDEIKEITVSKPSHFKSLMYRFKVILGLKRNAAGGFGGLVPEPTQHDSGFGYYGIG